MLKICIGCNNEFNAHQQRVQYCNRTCYLKTTKKWQNGKRDRRVVTCNTCGKPIQKHKSTICRSCFINAMSDKTIKQAISNQTGPNKYRRVRDHARILAMQYFVDKCCTNCGYDKHVHVAHRQALADFPDSTTLKEVNAKTNLILLCPNCHWEFDNGLLKI